MKIKRKELNEIYDILNDVVFAKTEDNPDWSLSKIYIIPHPSPVEAQIFDAMRILSNAGVTGTEED